MTRPANLHVLTREALERARVSFPDPLIDVEHRGEGDCELDGAAFVDALASLLETALAALAEDESLWMRSSGTDSELLTVDLRWRGEEPDPARLANAHRIAADAGAHIVRGEPAGERHLGLRVYRLPAPV